MRFLCVFLALAVTAAVAKEGEFPVTVNGGFPYISDYRVTNGLPYAERLGARLTESGRLLISSPYVDSDNTLSASVSMLLPDLTNDPTFNGGQIAYATDSGWNADTEAALVDNSGRAITAGYFAAPTTGGPEQPHNVIVSRWLANGSADPEFGSGGVKELVGHHMERVTAIVERQSGGYFLLGTAGRRCGNALCNPYTSVIYVLALLENGNVDSDFGASAGFLEFEANAPSAVAVFDVRHRLFSNGDLLLAGISSKMDASHTQHSMKTQLRRITDSGTLRAGWGTNGLIEIYSRLDTSIDQGIVYPATPLILEDGGFVIPTYSRTDLVGRAELHRFNSNGQYVNTFGDNGIAILKGPTPEPDDELLIELLLLPNSKILAVGGYTTAGNYQQAMTSRHYLNGDPDYCYGTGAISTPDLGIAVGETKFLQVENAGSTAFVYGRAFSEDFADGLVLGQILLRDVNDDRVPDDWDMRYSEDPHTPEPFCFADVEQASLNTSIASSRITVTDLAVDSTVATVAGGEVKVNNGAWSPGPVNVQNGDTVQVRLQTAATVETTKTVTLTIGEAEATFNVRTGSSTPPPPPPTDGNGGGGGGGGSGSLGLLVGLAAIHAFRRRAWAGQTRMC